MMPSVLRDNLFNRAIVSSLSSADVGANDNFIGINFSRGVGRDLRITGIEFGLSPADVVDVPKIVLFPQIVKGKRIVQGVSIFTQFGAFDGSIDRPYYRLVEQQPFDRSDYWEEPLVLEGGEDYAVFVGVGARTPLVNDVRPYLLVRGKYQDAGVDKSPRLRRVA